MAEVGDERKISLILPPKVNICQNCSETKVKEYIIQNFERKIKLKHFRFIFNVKNRQSASK